MPGRRELNLQGEVMLSVRKDGGYCRKLASKYTTGIPDLLVGLYPFVPHFAEVKDLGPVPDVFSRKIMATPRQYEEMRRMNLAYEPNMRAVTQKHQAALLLVGWTWGHDRWLAALPYDTHHVTADVYAIKRQKGGYFPIRTLLTQFGQLARMDHTA